MSGPPPPHAPDPSAGYERKDADAGKILVIGGILTVATLITIVVAGWVDSAFTSDEPPADRHPLAPEEPVLPPEPRLQVKPLSDLQAHQAHEEALLGSYGWLDREMGIARVPVDVAVDVALGAGFPTARTASGEGER